MLIAISIAVSSYSQEEASNTAKADKQLNNAIGVAAGMTTGYGISYRRYVQNFGLQLTFAPYKKSDDYSSDERIHFGFTFLYNVVKNNWSTLYVYQSNYLYWRKENYKYMTGHWQQPPTEVEVTNISQEWNHGIGIGMEFIIARAISLNLMGGYGAFEDFNNYGLTIEGGLYYKF